MATTKKKTKKVVKIEEPKSYKTDDLVICTRCGRTSTKLNISANKFFFKSKSTVNNFSGYLYNCKTCCNAIYWQYNEKYNDHSYCVYLMCRLYDYPFEVSVVRGAVKRHDKGAGDNPFALYTGLLWGILAKKSVNATSFEHWKTEYEEEIVLDIKDSTKAVKLDDEMKEKWGDWFKPADYTYLENKYNKLAENIIVDEAIHELIIQACYACHEQRELRKLPWQEKDAKDRIDKLTKTIQDLTKSLGMDAKSKVEKDNGKLMNSLGMAIDEYEHIDPIDILGELDTLKDVNNIEGYLKDYVYRPIRNNILSVREFKLEHTTEDEDFEYLDKNRLVENVEDDFNDEDFEDGEL